MQALLTAQRVKQKGFTLIELLVVIAIIAALAVVVFVALKPSQRLQDARDARRSSDVDTILTAVHSYVVDNKGSLPAGLTTGMAETQLGTGASGCAIATSGCAATPAACVNLTTPLSSYLKLIPVDPKGGTTATTQYSIVVDANNIVTVRSCGAENIANISASR
jgi:prepilin-type N-terminal cleavage/methylation domain-containing protein